MSNQEQNEKDNNDIGKKDDGLVDSLGGKEYSNVISDDDDARSKTWSKILKSKYDYVIIPAVII
jgi:hypothetical protein